jgi:3-isopropylmalate/(R)-2-methylmalate dehydratase small subunit
MAQVIAKFGDDISTDIIYPGRFMATVLPEETPQFAFADDEELNRKLRSGEIEKASVIVAGSNFGSGSSREQAASTLKGYELIIVARSFARIFLQNAINLGLQTVECPEIEAELGHEIEITADGVVNKTLDRSFQVKPFPASRTAVADAGGLIAYTRQKVMEQSTSADADCQ